MRLEAVYARLKVGPQSRHRPHGWKRDVVTLLVYGRYQTTIARGLRFQLIPAISVTGRRLMLVFQLVN